MQYLWHPDSKVLLRKHYKINHTSKCLSFQTWGDHALKMSEGSISCFLSFCLFESSSYNDFPWLIFWGASYTYTNIGVMFLEIISFYVVLLLLCWKTTKYINPLKRSLFLMGLFFQSFGASDRCFRFYTQYFKEITTLPIQAKSFHFKYILCIEIRVLIPQARYTFRSSV